MEAVTHGELLSKSGVNQTPAKLNSLPSVGDQHDIMELSEVQLSNSRSMEKKFF